MKNGNVKIFSGSSNPMFAEKLSKELGLPLGDAKMIRFQDGEVYVKLNETVRGDSVFVIQSTSNPVNENLMEMLVFIDALKRASADEIIAVIPYYGYARQDRKASPREPITAKLVANLLTSAGADRVMTMDLHAQQLQGFFDIPVDHMEGLPVIAKYFMEKGLHGDDVVVVSPDVGGVKRARGLARWLDTKIAIIDKRRPKPNESEVMNIIGDIEGKIAIFVDDIIDTAGTMTNGAEAVINRGAKEAYAACTHAVFSGPAIDRIEKSPFKEVVITNTIQQPEEKKIDKIKILSVSEMFSEGIKRIINKESLSELFEKESHDLK